MILFWSKPVFDIYCKLENKSKEEEIYYLLNAYMCQVLCTILLHIFKNFI